MTVASATVVMAAMFRIRWRITICLLEIGLRVVLLSAFFARSGVRGPTAAPALGLVPGFFDSSVLLIGPSRPTGVVEQPKPEKIGV